MKYNKLKYLFIAILSTFAMSCEDDDPLTAGDGDPLNKDVVEVSTTISPASAIVAEGRNMSFNVTLGQSFSSDATITAKIILDNGNFATGTATVTAGGTSGTGTIVVPADDGFLPAELFLMNAGTLQATAILLDELEPNTTYVLDSNVADLSVYADSQAVDAGLNIQFDWEGAPAVDLDMYVFDTTNFDLFERAESGSRFEIDLFQTQGRPDGEYIIYTIPFTPDPLDEVINATLLMTTPDNDLIDFNYSFPVGTSGFVPLATFVKETNVETGIVSYTTFTQL